MAGGMNGAVPFSGQTNSFESAPGETGTWFTMSKSAGLIDKFVL